MSINVLISSFNQIRNFAYWMLPVSTAKWDPKWFHDFKGHNHRFVDKRAVINGLRCEELVFSNENWKLLTSKKLECFKDCKFYEKKHPCAFEELYLMQLRQIDFAKLMMKFKELIDVMKEQIFTVEPIVVLCVHESLSRNCAERPVLQQWFKEHGVTLRNFEDVYSSKNS